MLKIFLAQVNPKLGDFTTNITHLIEMMNQAKKEAAQLLFLAPPGAITGGDLQALTRSNLVQQELDEALKKLLAVSGELTIITVVPHLVSGEVQEAIVILKQGVVYWKDLAVKECQRIYQCWGYNLLLTVGTADLKAAYLAQNNSIDLIINFAAEAFTVAANPAITDILVTPWQRPLVWLNLAGGCNDKVYSGGSFLLNAKGEITTILPFFEAQGFSFVLDLARNFHGEFNLPSREPTSLLYAVVRQGIKDYVEKNNFDTVIIGLSGGIDSVLTAVLAVDALGSKRVRLYYLPSRFSAEISRIISEQLAKNLRIKLTVWPIDDLVEQFKKTLVIIKESIVTENLQARIRMILLMAEANKSGSLLLNTTNRSERLVGYGTMYGDLAGGFAPLRDVYKTQIYALARSRNLVAPVIPEAALTREPSAELAFQQKDTDFLPPYEELDPILALLSTEIDGLASLKVPTATIIKVWSLMQRALFKIVPMGPTFTAPLKIPANHHLIMKLGVEHDRQ